MGALDVLHKMVQVTFALSLHFIQRVSNIYRLVICSTMVVYIFRFPTPTGEKCWFVIYYFFGIFYFLLNRTFNIKTNTTAVVVGNKTSIFVTTSINFLPKRLLFLSDMLCAMQVESVSQLN